MRYENSFDLLELIALGKNSVFELEPVELGGNRVIGLREHGMVDELATMASTTFDIVVLVRRQ